MKALIIDNTLDQDSWGSESLRRFVTASKDRTAFVRRSPHGDLPLSLKPYDRILLSGSRKSCLDTGDWVSDVDRVLRSALDTGIPILGICYGHQALARVLGGVESLRESPTPEYGWIEIETVAESGLFSGLPPRFWSFSSHHEEVFNIPPRCHLIARSSRCAIQGFELENGKAFGIQFHPERALETAEATIANWSKSLKKNSPIQEILNAASGKDVFDPEVGVRIFENFLRKD